MGGPAFQRPAGASALADDLKKFRRLHPLGHAKGHRLGHRRDLDADEHLVDRLHRRPGADLIPQLKDLSGHRVKRGSRLGKGFGAARGQDGQRAGSRLDRAARHWGVKVVQAQRRAALAKVAGHVRGNRGAGQNGCTGGKLAGNPCLTKQHRLGLGGVDDDDDNGIKGLGDLGNGARRPARSLKARDSIRIHVISVGRQSRPQQGPRHAIAHRPKTKYRDRSACHLRSPCVASNGIPARLTSQAERQPACQTSPLRQD